MARVKDETLFSLLRDYLTIYLPNQRRSSPNTVKSYRSVWNQFLKYPEDSAGSVMTAEFVNLKKNMTVADAFEYIRRHGVDKETIYTCYVTDDTRRLQGVVTVKDLLMSSYETKIDDNVIVGGMIKAGAITADKMSAELIHLGKGQGFAGNGATVSSEGMRIDGADGSSVTFSRDGLIAKDKNGNTFSAVNHIMIGSARNGQYVRFRTPWPTVPAVVVSPMNVVVADSAFTSQKVSFHCYASEISRNGFRMNMYSSIGNSSGAGAYHQDLGHWHWRIGRRWTGGLYGNDYEHVSQSWTFPGCLADRLTLHGHIRVTRGYDGYPEVAFMRGNYLGFLDENHQRLTVTCNGQQKYSGAMMSDWINNMHNCPEGDHTFDFVSPSFPITPNTPINCTLDLSPETDHPGDGVDDLDVYITVDSIEYGLSGDQKLDTNGTGMFIAVSKNSQLYTVQ